MLKYFSDSDLSDIKALLLKNVEACGIIYNSKGKFRLVLQSYGDEKSDRSNCKNTSYYKYIWHTHPCTLKAYPSAEDILKVIKSPKIFKSFIFTKWGVWILSSTDSTSLNKKKLINFIVPYLHRLYYKTNRGRGAYTKVIGCYISIIFGRIRSLINRFLDVDLRFEMIPWKNLNMKNVCS